jgi:hypothetical protein
MPSILNATLSNGLVTSADNSGEIELQSNGTTALKVNTNEGIQILNCLGVGNATPSTSGAGITFPATQSASTDANTLDDYEEGTWTPTNAGDATGVISGPTGEYVKVGRMVYVRGVFQVTTNFSSNAIGGLPFTFSGATTTSGISGGCIVFNSGASNLSATPVADATTINFYTSANTANTGGLTTANNVLRFWFVYRSNS